MSEAGPNPPIRNAASIVLTRRDGGRATVLMGQRGPAAVFMPDKFVFPGGALDPGDLDWPQAAAIDPESARRLAIDTPPDVARALPLAAVRELWEETGLRLGLVDAAAVKAAETAPPVWRGFLAAGLRPRTEALRFVFRAITPPGRPRRFDARFFLADATALADDHTDFTRGDAELSMLHWVDLEAAQALPLPFITTVVLAEIEAAIEDRDGARPIPFFHHDDRGSHFRLI